MTTELATATPATANVVPFQQLQQAALDASALLSKAVEAKLPVESMERLLAMRAELRAEQGADAFAVALAAFQRELPAIPKRQTANIVSQRGKFSYRYADLADIQGAIAERLAANGLAVTFDTEDHGQRLDVICTVHHTAGHSQSARFPVPVDQGARMNAAQQVGAALTYGRRYALTAALGIVTAEDDTDAQGAPERTESHHGAQRPSRAAHPTAAHSGAPQPARHSEASNQQPPQAQQARISPAQHTRLEARIAELGLDRERVKRWCNARWRVASFPDLSPAQYRELDTRLPGFATQAQQEVQPSPQSAAPSAAEKADAEALESAKYHGWSGALAELPAAIAKMRESAQDTAFYADMADDPSARRRDKESASALRVKADRCEAYLERQARQEQAA